MPGAGPWGLDESRHILSPKELQSKIQADSESKNPVGGAAKIGDPSGVCR